VRTLQEQVDRGKEIGNKVKIAAKQMFSRKATNYARTFGTVEGKWVLADLCKDAGVFDSNLYTDPLVMAYKNGQKDFAIQCINYSGQGKWDIARKIQESDSE